MRRQRSDWVREKLREQCFEFGIVTESQSSQHPIQNFFYLCIGFCRSWWWLRHCFLFLSPLFFSFLFRQDNRGGSAWKLKLRKKGKKWFIYAHCVRHHWAALLCWAGLKVNPSIACTKYIYIWLQEIIKEKKNIKKIIFLYLV